MSVDTLPLLVALVVLAFTVEGALGFGATLIAVTLGALIVPVAALVPAFVPVNMALSGLVAWRARRDVDRRWLATRAVPLMLFGMPAGMAAARVIDGATLVRALGGFVCVVAALELARRPIPLPAPLLLVAGGIVHGACGTGGPLVVAAAGRSLVDKARFRATLSALWIVPNALLLAGFWHDGALGEASLKASLVLALGVLPGALLGERLHRRVPAGAFRVVVWTGLAVAGLVLVVR